RSSLLPLLPPSPSDASTLSLHDALPIYNGELGDSTVTLRTLPAFVPFQPPGASFGVHIAVGDSHTCATSSVSELYCWGSDSTGQLGIGSQNDRLIFPALVSGSVSFVGVTAGRAHTCAIAA